MNRIRLFTGAIIVLGLSACATLDKSECREADWQIIGLEDGAAGRPLSYLGRHRKACAEYGIKPNLAQYELGHQSGLRQFCTPQNGFRQGRSGRGYNEVCPVDLETSFIAAYETGRELYLLDSEIDEIHVEVRDLHNGLEQLIEQQQEVETRLVSQALTVADRKTLLNRFKKLQTDISAMESDIRELEIEAAHKQGEYDVLDNMHAY